MREPYLSSIMRMQETTRRRSTKRIKAQLENLQPTTTGAKLETRRDLILPANIVMERRIHITNVGEDQTPSAPNVTRRGIKL